MNIKKKKNILLQNDERIVSIIISCKTKEQIEVCSNWIDTIKSFNGIDRNSTRFYEICKDYLNDKLKRCK
jgi:hypothetical protein